MPRKGEPYRARRDQKLRVQVSSPPPHSRRSLAPRPFPTRQLAPRIPWVGPAGAGVRPSERAAHAPVTRRSTPPAFRQRRSAPLWGRADVASFVGKFARLAGASGMPVATTYRVRRSRCGRARSGRRVGRATAPRTRETRFATGCTCGRCPRARRRRSPPRARRSRTADPTSRSLRSSCRRTAGSSRGAPGDVTAVLKTSSSHPGRRPTSSVCTQN
jgi:hypothetical protein